jgi:hypothetical protein
MAWLETLKGENEMAVSDANRQVFTVYDPTADEDEDQEPLAPRFTTLDRKTVGLLDNTKDLVEVLFDEVKTLLEKDFPETKFKYFRKHSVNGATAEMLNEIATCDAVISAVGD